MSVNTTLYVLFWLSASYFFIIFLWSMIDVYSFNASSTCTSAAGTIPPTTKLIDNYITSKYTKDNILMWTAAIFLVFYVFIFLYIKFAVYNVMVGQIT